MCPFLLWISGNSTCCFATLWLSGTIDWPSCPGRRTKPWRSKRLTRSTHSSPSSRMSSKGSWSIPFLHHVLHSQRVGIFGIFFCPKQFVESINQSISGGLNRVFRTRNWSGFFFYSTGVCFLFMPDCNFALFFLLFQVETFHSADLPDIRSAGDERVRWRKWGGECPLPSSDFSYPFMSPQTLQLFSLLSLVVSGSHCRRLGGVGRVPGQRHRGGTIRDQQRGVSSKIPETAAQRKSCVARFLRILLSFYNSGKRVIKSGLKWNEISDKQKRRFSRVARRWRLNRLVIGFIL